MGKKFSFEYVYDYFKENDCELLEKEYINCYVKMKYICECGGINEISFNNFKLGKRCKKCGIIKSAKQRKFSFKYVFNYFKTHGCELLEKEYIGCNAKMRYRCICGNISKTTFTVFNNGHRCSKCAGNERLTFEFVKNYFKKQGCKLLEKKYINNNTKMRYVCNCGNKSAIQFNNFKNGARCVNCSNSNYSKESQKLFNIIYEKISRKYKDKTYYATLNKEFGINYKRKNFKYDYVNSKLKKAIEYNGSVWHPLPNLKDSDKGWHIKDRNKTAKEARDYEKIKYEALEKRGYEILTIWDYELKKDFDIAVQKCLDFLII